MSEPDNKKPINRLIGIMKTLRAENGCPWDREQTVESLKPNLIEECYETLDAIDSGDVDKHKEELGDVLLQVIFHSRIREEEGAFNFDDVANSVCEKLIRRHPHVFGDAVVNDSKEVLQNWEEIKRAEKGTDKRSSTFSGLPRSMPAQQKANHVQERAARVGFDWNTLEPVLGKIEEEFDEVKTALAQNLKDEACGEIGDLLFATVNLARFMNADAESLLHKTIEKFIHRFQYIEDKLLEEGKTLPDCDLSELDRYWEKAKEKE